MDEFTLLIKKILSQLKSFINTLYNNLLFLFNKQKTLQKIYEPVLQNRLKENEALRSKLIFLKNNNKTLRLHVEKVRSHNEELKKDITILKNLIIDKNEL